MNPCEETLQDIPKWLWPTSIQNSHPHPAVVDFLPWPSLRDYLCLNASEDPRHSISFYFDSMELVWPSNCPLFAQDEGGEISLSPAFETVIWSLENWRLGPPFTEAFPQLVSLFHP
jgi:hypothetical protein